MKKLFLLFPFFASVLVAQAQSLGPALQARLVALASSSNSAILLWDIPRNEPLAAVREEIFSGSACVGSLIKPFLLLAYLEEAPGQDHDKRFQPCVGHATALCRVPCWYKPGHGQLDMKKALALSCNQYFYQVAEKIRPEVFLRLLRETGVQALGSLGRTPGSTNKDQAWTRPEALMGLDATLRFEPLQLLRAYLALLVDASGTIERISFRAGRESATSNIAAGLRLSSLLGTSVLAQKALPPNQPLLGKTGTSPGLVGGHYATDKTDGWFIGLYPAPQPTLAVMIYYPNGLGAKHAAPLGGLAIRTYLELVRQ